VRRAEAIVERLNELGVPVSFERVRALAGRGAIGRPHIARAMVELGVIEDIPSAFTAQWIARGGRAYVEKFVLEPAAAIALVHAAGGVAVVAHPGDDDWGAGAIERWASAGLDGVEVDHPSHGPATRQRLRSLARRFGLVATGSSDYHGFNKDVRLGENVTDPEAYETLVARASGVPVVAG
jgi:predicted metal-dependent phosphoesterase TrpH